MHLMILLDPGCNDTPEEEFRDEDPMQSCLACAFQPGPLEPLPAWLRSTWFRKTSHHMIHQLGCQAGVARKLRQSKTMVPVSFGSAT